MGSFNIHCSLTGGVISPNQKVRVFCVNTAGTISEKHGTGVYDDYARVALDDTESNAEFLDELRNHCVEDVLNVLELNDDGEEDSTSDPLLDVLEGNLLDLQSLGNLMIGYVVAEAAIQQCPPGTSLTEWLTSFGVVLMPFQGACQDYENKTMRHWLIAQQAVDFPYAYQYHIDKVSVDMANLLLANLKALVTEEIPITDCYWQSAGLEEGKLVAHFKLKKALTTLPEGVVSVKIGKLSDVPLNWA